LQLQFVTGSPTGKGWMHEEQVNEAEILLWMEPVVYARRATSNMRTVSVLQDASELTSNDK